MALFVGLLFFNVRKPAIDREERSQTGLVRAPNHGSAPRFPDMTTPDAGEHKADREVFAIRVVRGRDFDVDRTHLAPALRSSGSTQKELVSSPFERSFPVFDGIPDYVANGGILVLPIPERHARDAVFRAAVLDVRLASFIGICDVASNPDAFVDGSDVLVHASMITENRHRVKGLSKGTSTSQ